MALSKTLCESYVCQCCSFEENTPDTRDKNALNTFIRKVLIIGIKINIVYELKRKKCR